MENILVIKLSALGDFVQALGAMAAIRKHHPNAHITLLTTKPFKEFAQKCGYFDDIIIDSRPKLFNIPAIISLRKQLVSGGFAYVYDLQNNERTSFYSKLFPKSKQPEWVGAKRGVMRKKKQTAHAFARHKQALEGAGISDIEIDNLEWMKEDISEFNLVSPYIMLVAGCAPQHPQKRWPKEKYGELACKLTDLGYQIVIIGTSDEEEVSAVIAKICPQAVNLTGQTSLFQIASMAHSAAGAVGNDTGPMHIIGAAGCPCIALFSSSSDPAKHAPRGGDVFTIQRDDLNMLEVDEVFEIAKNIVISV